MSESIFICGDQTLRVSWEGSLVGLSCLVAIAGSFAGLDCAERMRAAQQSRQRRRYFVAGATLIGVSIWTMHFVGMLAYRLSVPVSYDPILGTVSILAAAFGAGLAFLVVDRPVVTRAHVLLGGVAMGLAIASMHYIGMASMQMPAAIRYRPGFFAASVALAIVASTGALFLARQPVRRGPTGYWMKASSAIALGVAIAGMHYLGMAAACYVPTTTTVLDGGAVGPWSLKDVLIMAGLVIVGALLALAAKNAAERQIAIDSLKEERTRAVDALRAKEIFLAALSHELRTPLNPALLTASDGASNRDFPPAAREAFAAIAGHIALEAHLIDDLLDLTRIARGTLRVERQVVGLHEVLHNALAVVRPDLAAKQLDVTFDLAPEHLHVNADGRRLRQVFSNLLQNAAKYTPAGGKLAVRTRQRDDAVEFEVTDTGMGMTAAECERCFEAFVQGEHKLGGLGLGLAISRSIVEAHGGRISAESPGKGQGATFTVTLAAVAAPPEPPRPSSVSRSPFAASGLTVLLVEDHEPSRAALERLLVRREFQVTAVGTMRAALEAGRRMRFDVLITDLGLPDGDGYQLLAELSGNAPDVRIAVTGYGMEDDVQRTRSAGFSAHLTKPTTIKQLDAALAAADISTKI